MGRDSLGLTVGMVQDQKGGQRAPIPFPYPYLKSTEIFFLNLDSFQFDAIQKIFL